MRTLQEKYNGVNEGAFSKDQFLRDARLQLPNLVTRFNGYDDAVQILKNRGMIQEEKKETSTAELMRLADEIPTKELLQGLSKDAIDSLKKLAKNGKEKLGRALVKFGYLEPGDLKEARLTNKSLTDYRYKATNDMDKYPYEQILRGLRVELEGLQVTGTPTAEEYKKALAKVLKNLEKDEIYYTNQVAGISKKVDLHDKMVDVKKDNAVDTFNGLKKAQLKEGFKKLIKNILKENSEISGLYDDEEKYEREEKYGSYEEEDVYEMQEPKSDSDYKSELTDYLEDNQIYGYESRIHDIMTGPDEAENADELVRFLEDNQIYGRYGTEIEKIYADYPYDQHWMNQPDEDEVDDIPHPRGYEEASDEEDFDDLFESTDTEADRDMVRKLMIMYETEPSKFEKLHKQAQVQAATTNDIKYKHLLSLIDRAKAGALQSLANQDRYQAGIEGMDEGYDEDKIAKYKQYTYTLDGEVVEPEIAFFNHYIGAELNGRVYRVGSPDETGTIELRSYKGKTGMYTESTFETVSLKDIL